MFDKTVSQYCSPTHATRMPAPHTHTHTLRLCRCARPRMHACTTIPHRQLTPLMAAEARLVAPRRSSRPSTHVQHAVPAPRICAGSRIDSPRCKYVRPRYTLRMPILFMRATTPNGFEPLRAEPNGFLVHLLSHSDTVSYCAAKPATSFCVCVWHTTRVSTLRDHYREARGTFTRRDNCGDNSC